jgi:predicted nucleic acid-binding protein
MELSVDPSSLAFVDTNVLIYAFDASELKKHPVAASLVEKLVLSGGLVLSAQVLNEFYWASTRPHRKAPLSHQVAVRAIDGFAQRAKIISLDAELTLVALGAVERHKLSFWDALIWAAAKAAGAGVIYSEDFQSGRNLESVRFVNPFSGPEAEEE